MASLEKLRRPGAMITVVATDENFRAAARVLEEDLRKQPLAAEHRGRDGATVLLVWDSSLV